MEGTESPVIIRTARREDAERLLEIYAYYVLHTAISFDYEVPSVTEFQDRIAHTLQRYPWIVLEDAEGIRGYAYAGPFIARKAYDRSCELSIYLERNAVRKGYGRRLYEALEAHLTEQGICNLYACIGDPIEEDAYLTRNSEQFHRHLGFVKVGTFHRCGYKFGRWYNMIYMEKMTDRRLAYDKQEDSSGIQCLHTRP